MQLASAIIVDIGKFSGDASVRVVLTALRNRHVIAIVM